MKTVFLTILLLACVVGTFYFGLIAMESNKIGAIILTTFFVTAFLFIGLYMFIRNR